jgi:hypothetical protein
LPALPVLPVLLVALLASRPADVVGQPLEELAPGARIRLHPDSDCPQCSVTGRLELFEGGRLELRADDQLLSFPLDSIRSLEVSRGKSWVPPVVGGVGGFFLSTGIFLAVFCSEPDTSCDGGNVAIASLVVGAPVGAIGMLVGLLLADERWEQLPLDRLGVVAGPGGIALRLSF